MPPVPGIERRLAYEAMDASLGAQPAVGIGTDYVDGGALDPRYLAGGRLDAIFFCPHASIDQCSCRKPAAGLFAEIIQRYGVNLKNVPAIGDSMRDLQAAITAGAMPIRVLTGKGQETCDHEENPANTQILANLETAVDALVGKG